MHAIHELTGGIPQAANGTAELYSRGTASRAGWYSDFEGSVLNTDGADILLDGGGSASVFVDGLTQVVVRDRNGEIVRDFVSGDAASAIEVRSASFTGADYETGATSPDKPTTLQAVLDSVKESFGSTDFQVLGATGVPVGIGLAVAGVAGRYRSVKSAEYGAVGNGIADDSGAVELAVGSPGIVFFPPGTYRITREMAVVADVHMQGPAIIYMDTPAGAGATCFEVAGGGHNSFRDLRFVSTSAASCNPIAMQTPNGGMLEVQSCAFDMGANNTTPVSFSNSFDAEARLVVEDCSFSAALSIDTMTTFQFIRSAGGFANISRCLFAWSGPLTLTADYISVYLAQGTVSDCDFDNTAMSVTGSHYDIFIIGTGVTTVTGCRFRKSGNAGAVFTNIHNDSAAARMAETGNASQIGTTNVYGGLVTTVNSSVAVPTDVSSRNAFSSTATYSTASAAASVDSRRFRTLTVAYTNSASAVWNWSLAVANAPSAHNQELLVVCYLTGTGTGTLNPPTLSGSGLLKSTFPAFGLTPSAQTIGTVRTMRFESRFVGSAFTWIPVSVIDITV